MNQGWIDTIGVFEYCLFCWNWNIITESIVDKGKS